MCVTVWVLRYKNKKNGDRGTIVFTATLMVRLACRRAHHIILATCVSIHRLHSIYIVRCFSAWRKLSFTIISHLYFASFLLSQFRFVCTLCSKQISRQITPPPKTLLTCAVFVFRTTESLQANWSSRATGPRRDCLLWLPSSPISERKSQQSTKHRNGTKLYCSFAKLPW